MKVIAFAVLVVSCILLPSDNSCSANPHFGHWGGGHHGHWGGGHHGHWGGGHHGHWGGGHHGHWGGGHHGHGGEIEIGGGHGHHGHGGHIGIGGNQGGGGINVQTDASSGLSLSEILLWVRGLNLSVALPVGAEANISLIPRWVINLILTLKGRGTTLDSLQLNGNVGNVSAATLTLPIVLQWVRSLGLDSIVPPDATTNLNLIPQWILDLIVTLTNKGINLIGNSSINITGQLTPDLSVQPSGTITVVQPQGANIDLSGILSGQVQPGKIINLTGSGGTFDIKPGTFDIKPGTFDIKPGQFNIQQSAGTFDIKPSVGTFDIKPGTLNIKTQVV